MSLTVGPRVTYSSNAATAVLVLATNATRGAITFHAPTSVNVCSFVPISAGNLAPVSALHASCPARTSASTASARNVVDNPVPLAQSLAPGNVCTKVAVSFATNLVTARHAQSPVPKCWAAATPA